MGHLRAQIKFRPNWILGFSLALAIPLYSVVVHANLNYGSVHLLMGNPSDATESVDNPTNHLMIKPQYALSYSRDRNIANWASWQLNAIKPAMKVTKENLGFSRVPASEMHSQLLPV